MKNEFMIIGYSDEFTSKKGARMRAVTIQEDRKKYNGIFAYTVFVKTDSLVGNLVEGAFCELHYYKNSDIVSVLKIL